MSAPTLANAVTSNFLEQEPRAHVFELPIKDDRNFISCLLYKDIY